MNPAGYLTINTCIPVSLSAWRSLNGIFALICGTSRIAHGILFVSLLSSVTWLLGGFGPGGALSPLLGTWDCRRSAMLAAKSAWSCPALLSPDMAYFPLS